MVAFKGWRQACFVVFTAVAMFIAYWAGRVHQDLSSRSQRQDDEITTISNFLSQRRDRFGELRINRGPLDKFHLEGPVRTREDLDALRSEMTRLFGEKRADYILEASVDTEKAGPQSTTRPVGLGEGRQNPKAGIPQVRLDDLGNSVVVIGRLGKPLGDLCSVNGFWMARPVGKSESMVFEVTHVNGEKLENTVRFGRSQIRAPLAVPTPSENEKWELSGIETGGFQGMPNGYWEATGLPPGGGQSPWRFESTYHCATIKVLKE